MKIIYYNIDANWLILYSASAAEFAVGFMDDYTPEPIVSEIRTLEEAVRICADGIGCSPHVIVQEAAENRRQLDAQV